MPKRWLIAMLVLVCAAGPVATAEARQHRPKVSPKVKGFSFSPRTFPAASSSSTAGARGAVTTITFRLSKPGRVVVKIARAHHGRRLDGHCVKPARRLRTRRRCTRYVRAGKLKRRYAKAGPHAIAFSGRLHGRALPQGRYRATIVARDKQHRKSKPRRARFIVAPGGGGPTQPGAPPLPGSPPPAPGSPPTPSGVGVPAGWVPAQTRSGSLTVSQAGAVVQDILFTRGDLVVNAANVTVRRVKLQGGRIINTQGSCKNGLVVEDSTFEPPPGQQYSDDSEGMTGAGGYTARRVLIWRRQEGFRDGGKSSGCGPVTIEDSFAKIAIPPGCPGDPHSDGIQGYDGPPLTVRNVTIDFREASCGTAPFFVPNGQGNTSVDVNGLLVMGGGFTFRLGVSANVRALKIVDDSWHYEAVDVRCSAVDTWEAERVTIDSNYNVTGTRGAQRCTGTGN